MTNKPTEQASEDFDKWWNGDKISNNNPFRQDSPAFFAREGWQASRASAGEQISEAREKELEEVLRERDDADEFIDVLLDEVLGADRAEWSSSYGRAEAMQEVRERITALHKPAVDLAWAQFEALKRQEPAAHTRGHDDTCIKCPRDPNKVCDYCGFLQVRAAMEERLGYTPDAIYAAWHKVGADRAGLMWCDFAVALDGNQWRKT